MPLSLLFDHFDRLITRPGDLSRLNQAILQLAVQGKLVPQDPTDEPASELLNRIRAEKERLLLTGQLRRDEPLPPIGEDETPYELPKSWSWVRLGDISEYGNRESINGGRVSDDTWVLDLEDIEKATSRLLAKVQFKDRNFQSSKNVFREGDVLYGKLRPYLDKVIVADEDGLCSSEIVPIRGYPGIYPYYLKWALKRPDFLDYVNSRTYGTKMPRLGTKDAQMALIPLPPLAEQKRIVAKVEALLAQSQALAAELAAAEAEQSRLSRASLHHLLAAPTPADFAPRWHFVATHFDAVTPDPESVDGLKQAILQLAVQGKLVEQDSADEPASELLKCISARKQRLAKEGKLKPEKPLLPISEDETPYELPKGWEWVRLDEISDIGTGSTPSRADKSYFEDGTSPWITSSATNELFISEASEYITDLAVKKTRLRLYPKHSLIVALYGQGKTRGQVSELLIEATINQACAAIVLEDLEPGIRPYIKLFFLKNYEDLRSLAEGGAQPNLNLGKIKAVCIPLPPLAEQKRIVAKVEGLLRQCDELKAALVAGEGARVKVLESALWGVLNGTQI